MSENESSSKKVYDSGRDRLSELPSSIIEIILSSISTRDAVRMSILSKQYMYAWISLPHLLFDKSEFRSMKRMDEFVTNVLILHKGPIHKVTALLKPSQLIVDTFLDFLPDYEIRELILKLDEFCCYQEFPIVYSSNKLTHLEVHRCRLGPKPSTFTGFLFLRCLILVDLVISLNEVESIVADSPLLETLKMHDCHSSSPLNLELKISAPSLKYFDLESSYSVRLYLYTPLLAEMSVRITYGGYSHEAHDGILEIHRLYYNYAKFFGGCNSLQKLKGNYFTKVMSYDTDTFKYSFVLPHLKVIELDGVKYEVVKHISIIARLLTGAPNLQELKLTYDSCTGSDSEAPDVSYIDCFSALSFKWEKLKMIKMLNLTSLPSKIQFLKLLLENSPALERMNLHTHGVAFHEVKFLREELLKCNLACPNFTLTVVTANMKSV